MAIVKTRTEVQEIHPRLISGTSKDALLPNFEAAEYKHLVPIVGVSLYNDISTKYNAAPSTLSTIESTLHKKMQALVIAAAYMEEAPRNVAKITDNGIRSANADQMQRIYGWEFREFKQGLIDLYYDSMEVLLQWLYDNRTSFALWTTDATYTRYNELLIKSGSDFSNYYRLHQPLRNFFMLRAQVQEVQYDYHRFALGADLLTYFRTVELPTDDEKEIIDCLKRAMAYLTIYRACRVHTVRFGDTGFTITSSDVEAQSTTNGPAGTLFAHHMRSAEEDGMKQLTRAKRLCAELAVSDTPPANFLTAFNAGPLATYTTPSISERNDALTKGFRLGI